MALLATGVERRMRGGAQAHLLACQDGAYYVTKFRENPQSRRILINEWIASVLLRFLRIHSPEVHPVSLPPDLLAREPISLQLGQSRIPVGAGRHFGSRFPGHPARDAVYDYLPDALLEQIVNLEQFRAVLVFDKWAGNSDSRQAIFCRRRLLRGILPPAAGGGKGYAALMIDQGYIFDGPNWTFTDSPVQGFYFRPLVYRGVRKVDDFQPWLSQVEAAPEHLRDEIFRTMPQEWMEGDEEACEELLVRLWKRRARTADLILEAIRARPAYFPDWSATAGSMK